MWVMIEREREQKSELSDQIKRTNKLARTVMAMAEDEDEDSAGDSATDSSSGTNFVAEFAFLGRLHERVVKDLKKDKSSVPECKDLVKAVPA